MLGTIARERGSALALVVIFGLVLSILVAGLYVLFQSNTQSYVWKRNSMQARYSAEAGTALAVHMIMGGADVPGGDDPEAFLGDAQLDSWESLPGGLGEVIVYVDPHDKNEAVASANSYAVRARARIPTSDGYMTYGMESAVSPQNFARFACFLNSPDLSGAYADGYRFDGPFFANGPVRLWSASSGRNNDPWFYSFQLTSDSYVYGWGSNTSNVPHPPGSDLWVEPYERMLLGKPYFEMGADSIPFGPDEVNWESARDAALDGGMHFPDPTSTPPLPSLPSGTRMIVGADSLWIKTASGGTPDPDYVYCMDSLLTKRVIWVDNGNNDRLYIKGDPLAVNFDSLGVDSLLTIGCDGDIWPYGPLRYANDDMDDPNNRCLLGMISVHGDLIMADDPGAADWMNPWHIDMDPNVGSPDNIPYSAVIMTLSGEFRAEDWTEPTPMDNFNLIGGYIVDSEGYTTSGNSGLNSVIHYDTRLMTMHPPYFPQTGEWGTIYWKEWPDMDNEDLLVNTYGND
jgi:hypothetical protein